MNALALALVLSAAQGDHWVDAVLPVRAGWMELRAGGGYMHSWRVPPFGSDGEPLSVSTFRLGILDRLAVKAYLSHQSGLLGAELLVVRPGSAAPAVVFDLSSGIVGWPAGVSVSSTQALRLVWRQEATLLEVNTFCTLTFSPRAQPSLVTVLEPGVRLFQRLTPWVSLGLRLGAGWVPASQPPFHYIAIEPLVRVSLTEHLHAELAGRWRRDTVTQDALGATVAIVWTPQLWMSR